MGNPVHIMSSTFAGSRIPTQNFFMLRNLILCFPLCHCRYDYRLHSLSLVCRLDGVIPGDGDRAPSLAAFKLAEVLDVPYRDFSFVKNIARPLPSTYIRQRPRRE
jgi:hypothetical protein